MDPYLISFRLFFSESCSHKSAWSLLIIFNNFLAPSCGGRRCVQVRDLAHAVNASKHMIDGARIALERKRQERLEQGACV